MADSLLDLTTALQTYIVSPLNAFGMGGFVFDIQGESSATLAADITDHYTENNKALQDHIAIRPRKITLRGYVGELVFDTSISNSGILQSAVQKLTTISAFLPQLSAAAVQEQQAIAGANNAGVTPSSFAALIPPSANIYSLVKNTIGSSGPMPKQQAAYQYFAACQSSAVLMGIQTPWEFLGNMAIESIVAIQPEESIFITDFSITFKQIRIASTATATGILAGTGATLPAAGISQDGACALQRSPTTNNGVTAGVQCPVGTQIIDSPSQANMVDGTSYKSLNIAPIFTFTG